MIGASRVALLIIGAYFLAISQMHEAGVGTTVCAGIGAVSLAWAVCLLVEDVIRELKR